MEVDMDEMKVLKKIAEATIGSVIAVHIPCSWAEPLGANTVVDAVKWAISRIEELERENGKLVMFSWPPAFREMLVMESWPLKKDTDWFDRPDRWHEFGGW
jgi:hypothetical protein